MVTSSVLKGSTTGTPSAPTGDEYLVSADSHVLEPRDLWIKRLPAKFSDQLPKLPERTGDLPGATDPKERLSIMARDQVSVEILFPTFGLSQYGIEDPELQLACFRAYNDWIVEYCAETPGRLYGIPMIPTYDIDVAINELERCKGMGLKGAMTWHIPPAGLEYSTDHYERLWAASAEMDEPVNLHILTGFSYTKYARPKGIEHYRGSVEIKLNDAVHVLFDFIFYGILDRHPDMKLVLVEFEIGWIPWLLQQWDYYALRFKDTNPVPIKYLPSEYFERQVFASFVNDNVGTRLITAGWGINNCMWSNDFPHGNSSWPHSRENIVRDLSGVSAEDRQRLLSENVTELYHLDLPEAIERPA